MFEVLGVVGYAASLVGTEIQPGPGWISHATKPAGSAAGLAATGNGPVAALPVAVETPEYSFAVETGVRPGFVAALSAAGARAALVSGFLVLQTPFQVVLQCSWRSCLCTFDANYPAAVLLVM